jgi:hypothetical protein
MAITTRYSPHYGVHTTITVLAMMWSNSRFIKKQLSLHTSQLRKWCTLSELLATSQGSITGLLPAYLALQSQLNIASPVTIWTHSTYNKDLNLL